MTLQKLALAVVEKLSTGLIIGLGVAIAITTVVAFQSLSTTPSDSGFQSGATPMLTKTGGTFDRDTDSLEAIGERRYPAMGSDMWTTYFGDQSLFTPHTDNCSASEAFVALYTGATLGFCIEEDERTAEAWEDARETCAQAGKRLPEPAEWKYACEDAGTLGLNNMTDDWEHASNFSYLGAVTGYVLIAASMGNGSCIHSNIAYIANYTGGAASSFVFRCVH